jgi:hypothetical protein
VRGTPDSSTMCAHSEILLDLGAAFNAVIRAELTGGIVYGKRRTPRESYKVSPVGMQVCIQSAFTPTCLLQSLASMVC